MQIMAETFHREAMVAEREAARGAAHFTPNIGKIATVTAKIGSRHEAVSLSGTSKEDLAATKAALEASHKPPKAKASFPMRESDEIGWLAEEFEPLGASDADADAVGMSDKRLPKTTCDETRWAQAYYTKHGFTNPFTKAAGKQ